MNLIDIKSPADLKGVSLAELTDLTAQARQALLTKVSEHGGHVGPPMVHLMCVLKTMVLLKSSTIVMMQLNC